MVTITPIPGRRRALIHILEGLAREAGIGWSEPALPTAYCDYSQAFRPLVRSLRIGEYVAYIPSLDTVLPAGVWHHEWRLELSPRGDDAMLCLWPNRSGGWGRLQIEQCSPGPLRSAARFARYFWPGSSFSAWHAAAPSRREEWRAHCAPDLVARAERLASIADGYVGEIAARVLAARSQFAADFIEAAAGPVSYRVFHIPRSERYRIEFSEMSAAAALNYAQRESGLYDPGRDEQDAIHALAVALDAATEALEADFVAGLKSGRTLAGGNEVPLPLPPAKPETDLPSSLWAIPGFRLDPRKAEAGGLGRRFVNLQFRQAPDSQVAPPEGASASDGDLSSTSALGPTRRKGRPPIYDWNGMMEALYKEVMGGRHFTNQAAAERWAADWFMENGGKAPAEGDVREKVGPIYRAYEG